ncbi:MAG: ABC transporter permease [Candidatus Aegiribacteria sp.]|nr:ABC transporter permease [Candidatus Aegiribacteria sp.]
MFSDSIIILKKELRRIFTDRRMVAMLVLLPLLMLPVMYSVMAKMGASRDSDITSFRSTICIYEGVGNEDFMGPFIEAFSTINTDLEIIQSSEIDSVKLAITEKEKELLLVMPDHFHESLAGCSTFDIAVYFNSTADYSQHAYSRMSEVMDSLNGDIVRERILERDLSEEILTVFTINEVPLQYDLAKEGSVIGKIISILLPFFIIIYLFVNSMKVGLDTVAGEKERGTLAVILVNQVSRLSIVIGKMISVMIAAIVGAASSVIGLIIGSRYFMGMFGSSGAAISSYSMSSLHVLQFAIVLIPLAVLVASMVLIVSTFARNTKEGNGMIMPVYFVVMIMGMATMQTGDVAPRWMLSTPIINSLLVLKEIFMRSASWNSIVTAFLSSIIFAAILIYLTLRMFSSEKILFRI